MRLPHIAGGWPLACCISAIRVRQSAARASGWGASQAFTSAGRAAAAGMAGPSRGSRQGARFWRRRGGHGSLRRWQATLAEGAAHTRRAQHVGHPQRADRGRPCPLDAGLGLPLRLQRRDQRKAKRIDRDRDRDRRPPADVEPRQVAAPLHHQHEQRQRRGHQREVAGCLDEQHRRPQRMEARGARRDQAQPVGAVEQVQGVGQPPPGAPGGEQQAQRRQPQPAADLVERGVTGVQWRGLGVPVPEPPAGHPQCPRDHGEQQPGHPDGGVEVRRRGAIGVEQRVAQALAGLIQSGDVARDVGGGHVVGAAAVVIGDDEGVVVLPDLVALHLEGGVLEVQRVGLHRPGARKPEFADQREVHRVAQRQRGLPVQGLGAFQPAHQVGHADIAVPALLLVVTRPVLWHAVVLDELDRVGVQVVADVHWLGYRKVGVGGGVVVEVVLL
mmetsp:Transcript_21609/g.51316  ORF Transcript_21609/g.51316 Transcript_21609/m.51316 type:complete len:443 (-) Transcript_21609:736-2064(-)